MCSTCVVTLMISMWLPIHADDLRHRTFLHADESRLWAAAGRKQAKKALGYPKLIRLSRSRYSNTVLAKASC